MFWAVVNTTFGLTCLPHSVQMNAGINAEIVSYTLVEVSKVGKESYFFLICLKGEGDFYSDKLILGKDVSSDFF